jgi:uncharacterized protein
MALALTSGILSFEEFIAMLKSKYLIAAVAFLGAAYSAPASAQSFSCMNAEEMSAAEQRICASRHLQALDERLDHWYRRALARARYFDQTEEVRSAQRAWLASRNACGGRFWCLRRHYVTRIYQLKTYVEHV